MVKVKFFQKKVKSQGQGHEVKLDMCLWNTDAPGGNKVQIWQKISKSTFWPRPTPRGRWCQWSVRNPWMNLVQVWLLYHHLNFKYSTLFVSETELRTDGRTDGRTDRQTDDPITRCPRRTFQAWGIKNLVSTKRSYHKKYTCEIWKPYLFCFKSYGQG